jgi:hypothetical protein
MGGHDERIDDTMVSPCVALLDDRRRQVEHDRKREDARGACTLQQLPAGMVLDVRGVNDGCAFRGQPSRELAMERGERRFRRALIALVAGDDRSVRIRAQYVRSFEVAGSERRFAAPRRTDEGNQGGVGDDDLGNRRQLADGGRFAERGQFGNRRASYPLGERRIS